MPSRRQIFLSQVAQTSEMPMMIDIDRAEGVFIYDLDGKRYYDLNSGIAVSSLGHCHPVVKEAIQKQSERYLHTMVYGEHIQSPQIQFSQLLLAQLASHFQSIYYLSSGTEATELAMKLAKRYTGRYQIIACRKAYHGSTQGAESLRSDESYKAKYLPLLPGIGHIDYNRIEDLGLISEKTAAVICEVVQGEAGVVLPNPGYLETLQSRCREAGALLIVDEIQTGFGRTGRLFAHQKSGLSPDMLLIGKAMGGGMPVSGVVSSREIMQCLVNNPALGHITTFGGHPVSIAAAHASLKYLLDSDLIHRVSKKEALIKDLLQHPVVHEVRSAGLMMAVELKNRKYLKHVVAKAHEGGALIDWFLFNDRSFRLAPPLIIKDEEIREACSILIAAMDYALGVYQKGQ